MPAGSSCHQAKRENQESCQLRRNSPRKALYYLFNGLTECGGTPAEHHRVTDTTKPTTGQHKQRRESHNEQIIRSSTRSTIAFADRAT